VFSPAKETYVWVPAVDQAYARGLSLWQHRVIRRYAQCHLTARTDVVALAQAKAEIRELVERDFNRKSTRGRKRHARFMENHTGAIHSEPPQNQAALTVLPDGALLSRSGMHSSLGVHPAPDTPTAHLDMFTDDEILPVFEAALDLPPPLAPTPASANGAATEEADD
jgi:hypothetical protein